MSQQINLYNAAFVPPREWVTASGLAIATATVFVLVVAGALLAKHYDARAAAELAAAQAARAQAQAQLDATRALLEAAKPSAELQDKVATARARIALRERILEATQLNLAEPGSGFSRYLAGLARQGVAGLWLNQLAIDANSKSLSLSGQTLRQEAVPEYVRRLRSDPVFAGRVFAGIDVLAAAATTDASGAQAGGAVTAVPPAPTSGASGVPMAPVPMSFNLVASRSTESEAKTR